jgi:hypothetical protein
MRTLPIIALLTLIPTAVSAIPKPHVVFLGKATSVKLFLGPSEENTSDIMVRPLYVDTKLKEFTTGPQHDVTDREFVIRRAFRINDALPDDPHKTPQWLWQLGGWLLVNRQSGRIKSIALTDFDPFYSLVSWYRDYAAYCGITSNGERVNAIVSELGTRKPLYRRELGNSNEGDLPDADCPAPRWERRPARVTFLPKRGEKLTVDVKGRFAEEIDSPADE